MFVEYIFHLSHMRREVGISEMVSVGVEWKCYKGIKLGAIMYSLEFVPYLQRPEGQAASFTGWSLPRVLSGDNH